MWQLEVPVLLRESVSGRADVDVGVNAWEYLSLATAEYV